jgi:type I restriction enzyme S subunit
MQTQTNRPTLRFPEFNGEWEKKKLGEVTTYVDYRGRAPIKTEEGRFLVTAKNIKKGFIDYECSKEFVGEEDYLNVMSKGLPKIGDILFTTEAPMGNVAQLERDDIALAQRVIKFRGCELIENNYLLHYMLSTIFQNEISEKAIGTTVQGISGKELHKVNLSFPTLPEQTKIAEFFTAIDAKIQALKTKKEKLQQYKKGVMQQLFCQNQDFEDLKMNRINEDRNPKILKSSKSRFRQDNGKEFPKWEMKKLGEVCEIIMGQSPSSSSYNSDEIGVPLIQGNADIHNRISNPRNWTTEKTKECFIGDLILTVRAPVGAVAKSVHNACIGRGVCAIRNNNKSVIEFVYQFLLDYETKWSSLEQGSTFTAVSGVEIKKLEINLPSLPEQTKIAHFLSSLDEKINHTETQIQQTQGWKKGLLQRMFV